MANPVLYLPVITTLFSLAFSATLLRRYLVRGRGPHLLVWAIGVLVYGVGTFTEAFTSVFGWHEPVFRVWYISGALLGGAPLAQGTVYLLLRRKTAHVLSACLVTVIVVASVCVLASPVNVALAEPHRLSGKVLAWPWVRAFSPFINTYALIFLVGGAILSAVRFSRRRETHHRFVGNVLIAVGALLPGVGGTFTRFGYVEVLYVTELIGLSLIYLGYRFNIGGPLPVPAPAVRQPAGG
ncbi:MAG TPA: hypothetical protein VMT19_06265 [Thermoanaerobaculaceae bacterium]|nr:hypothetical protein [Thermoanaerobaculaceae bacterium]